jgi:hypothetical protein
MGLGSKALNNMCLNLRIYVITRHSHTPGIKDVPLAGIHYINHPEKQFNVIPIYEIYDGFRMLYFLLDSPKLSSIEEIPKYLFHIPRKPYVCKRLQTGKERGSL